MKRLAVAVAALGVLACSSGPEEAILSHYFTAARLRDSTTLAGFAAVSFEPGEQGIVTSFRVASVSAEQRNPLNAAAETGIAAMSVEDPLNKVDLTKADGELVTKEVTISAPVKLPNGQTSQKTLVVTMQRAEVTSPKPLTGRWIITAIEDTTVLPASKSS